MSQAPEPKYLLSKALPTSLVVKDLLPNTEYQIQIAAINIQGAGEYSDLSLPITTTPRTYDLPCPDVISYRTTAPPGIPGSFEEIDVDKDFVELSWAFDKQPNTSPPDMFVIQMLSSKDALWETVAKPPGHRRYEPQRNQK